LLAIPFVLMVVVYVFKQFSLLFSDMSAITMAGWIVIGLLIFSIFCLFAVRTRIFLRYLDRKASYETSQFYRDTALPYRKVLSEKGRLFEYEVSHALEKEFPSSPQILDLTIRKKDSINEYAQIDCIFIHDSGIYVLELKDYNGYVYGNKAHRFWNVGYETNGKKAIYEFQNPIMQNIAHINNLNDIVEARYLNIVIFSKNIYIDSNLSEIHTLKSLIDFIRSREVVYTKDVLKDILARIESSRIKGKNDDHIRRIQFNKAKYT